MTFARVLAALLLAALAVRALAFAYFAFLALPFPLEVSMLEAKSAWLCWRAREGLPLYPEWRFLPHEPNFFSPVYFIIVGGVGRVGGMADETYFFIGRAVTLLSWSAAALGVGWFAVRRYGRVPAFAAALFVFGSSLGAPFGVSVRPDVMADTVGWSGLFALTWCGPWSAVAAGALLTLAGFVKQTSFWMLAATLAGLGLARHGRAMGKLTLGVVVVVAVVLGWAAVSGEARFFHDVWGEAGSPWSWSHGLGILGKSLQWAPDVALLSAIACFTPRRGTPDSVGFSIIARIGCTVCMVTAFKVGSDVNYFLPLRVIAGVALARTMREYADEWSGGRRMDAARRAAAWLALMGLLAFSTLRVCGDISVIRGGAGIPMTEWQAAYARLAKLAANPSLKLFTNSGLLAMRQGKRAAFVDPWLFHLNVELGRIDPVVPRQRLDEAAYELLALTSPLEDAAADGPFSLPRTLADVARQRYEPIGMEANLFLYRRRPALKPNTGGR